MIVAQCIGLVVTKQHGRYQNGSVSLIGILVSYDRLHLYENDRITCKRHNKGG